jgi:hypothetical protein
MDFFYSSEWEPKTFQSHLAKEKHILKISCTSYVEMLENNQVKYFLQKLLRFLT